jgi:hypothetical protein
MTTAYKYRNFINKDPILDWLYTQTEYKMDHQLIGFDEELLLDNYIKKNKQIFCNNIFEELQDNMIKIDKDAFVMKTKYLYKYFNNHDNFKGNKYSLFTIEYSSIKTLKSGNISTSHKYYNFKNWLHKIECGFDIDHSFVLGRKYDKHGSFDYLVDMPYSFEELKAEADNHLLNLKYHEPNMSNTSDFPWHNAKKLIHKAQKVPERSNKVIENFNKLELPNSQNNIFIDFEILTSVFDDFSTFPLPNNKSILFNIGCVSKDSQLSLMAKNIKEEKGIFKQLIDYLQGLQGEVTLFHWTGIEKRIFDEKVKEFGIKPSKEIKWFDLHKYFVQSDIYIKDCENFKLKNVSRCLEKEGLITSKWDNGLFFDGLGAMTGYISYLNKKNEKILDEIAKYNLVDCSVMMEIYEVLVNLNQ